ncbi:UDP-N-acetylglucosamine 4-epimerase [subsurface metagenome]
MSGLCLGVNALQVKRRTISKKAVVTGGAGFIGSHLAELLANRGYYVIILDDLSIGKMANVEPLLKKANVEFIQSSIIDLQLLQQLFQGVDYIFHQAAIPSVPRSIENPEASHNVNVTGTLNVLLAARDNNIRKVVYASSSSVYGDTPELPKTEDMATNPLSPYAVTKLAGEHYCRVFHQVYGLPTACLRYFNVYGPRQDPESQYAAVIPKFITSVINGQGPIIFGDGEQSRDFTYIKDVIEANILAAESDVTGIFNIGNGKNITINQLAKLTINLLGNYSINSIHEGPRPGDIKDSLADITRAKTFGYSPKYDLEKGLYETVRSFTDES